MKVWFLIKDGEDDEENRRFKEEAEKEHIEVQFVKSEDFDIVITKEGRKSVLYNGNYINLPDCLIPRRGASTTYFDLVVIRHLEKLGVFTVNSSHSVEIAKDKLQTLQTLAVNKIPIPKTMFAKMPLDVNFIEKEFMFPLIIKTISGTQGKGVFLCNDKEQFEDFIDFVEVSKDPYVNIILQEFVSFSKGKDIRVFIIGGRAVGAMMRVAKEGRVRANFSIGGEVLPFELNPEIEWLAVESAKVLGLDIAGVDILFDDNNNYLVNEVNSSPGFKGFERATGINIPKEIYHYIKVRLGFFQEFNK
ncbi:MAG: alpha-L-glutamate ligase [Candidatus Nitrosocaldaceae archaeon]|nr:MAG: alpha-L-glutamate ligase [Candidatus Nitrosocaldaceae archaeon]